MSLILRRNDPVLLVNILLQMMVGNFRMRIYAESLTPGSVERRDDQSCFRYPADTTTVEVRISTSFVSDNQAIVSLNRECPKDMPFDTVALIAKQVWNK